MARRPGRHGYGCNCPNCRQITARLRREDAQRRGARVGEEYPDMKNTTDNNIQCSSCEGTTDCASCSGEGTKTFLFTHTCNSCEGDGVCRVCKGTGTEPRIAW